MSTTVAIKQADILDKAQSMRFAMFESEHKTHPAADELRRLSKENEELLALLKRTTYECIYPGYQVSNIYAKVAERIK